MSLTYKQRHLPSQWYQLFFWTILYLLTSTTAFAAEPVGSVTFSRGTVAAHTEGQKPRLLGQNADVFEGDNIQTSERSFVVISFLDNTKITVRPNSSFSIAQYRHQAQQDTAKFELHQGGIRASSGDIANNNPEDFQIITPDTSIKAQQADFSVRVCQQQSCQVEEDNLQKGAAIIKKEVIARVVEIKGLVVAANTENQTQDKRPLSVGAPLYSADTLTSEKNGYAVIAFKDKGRMTLEPDSQFAIKEYHFNEVGENNKALYNLVTGGMRVLTGSIGKADEQAYGINTPVATIGIRGTGFDLLERGKGLHSKVWQGTIAQTNDAGTTLLSAPHANYIKDKFSKPTDIDDIETNGPRPDQVAITNENELFSYIQLDNTRPGTYVDVHSGHVQVADSDGTPVDLGRNESSYTDKSSKTERTERPPEFMIQDSYPLPNNKFDEKTAGTLTYSLLADSVNILVDAELYQCVCK